MYLLRIISLLSALVFIVLNFSCELVNAEMDLDNEYKEVIKEFLPKNAELIEPKSSKQTQPIQQYDFDKDGQSELVVTYKEMGEPNRLKAMVLKKEIEQWKKVWGETGEGFDIHLSTLTDITGDGTKEYIIGWMIGASAGNKLEILQWQDNTFKKIYDYSFYHKIDTITQGKQ